MAIVNPHVSISEVFPSYDIVNGKLQIDLAEFPLLTMAEAQVGASGDAREFLRAILEAYYTFLKSRQGRPGMVPKNFTFLKANPAGNAINEFVQSYSVAFNISVSPNSMTVKAEQNVEV